MIRIILLNYLVRSMLGNVLANLWSSPTSRSINLPKQKVRNMVTTAPITFCRRNVRHSIMVRSE